MVQEAEALEKFGRPTFFETPAWSFNMGMKFLLGGWVRGLMVDANSFPPSKKGFSDGGVDFTATMKQPRYAGTDTNNGTNKSGRGD